MIQRRFRPHDSNHLLKERQSVLVPGVDRAAAPTAYKNQPIVELGGKVTGVTIKTASQGGRLGKRALERTRIAVAVGLCLLCAPVLRFGHEQSAARPPARAIPSPLPPRPRSPFDAALRDAVHHWIRALDASDRERYAVEAWDPAAAHRIGADAWRLQLMAQDPSGDLIQARIAAQRAASIAATPEETYRATLWLAAIEHDSGHHAAELRQARRLMALAPHRAASLQRLRHAALCNGLKRLAQQADAALRSLPAESQGAKREIQPPRSTGRAL